MTVALPMISFALYTCWHPLPFVSRQPMTQDLIRNSLMVPLKANRSTWSKNYGTKLQRHWHSEWPVPPRSQQVIVLKPTTSNAKYAIRGIGIETDYSHCLQFPQSRSHFNPNSQEIPDYVRCHPHGIPTGFPFPWELPLLYSGLHQDQVIDQPISKFGLIFFGMKDSCRRPYCGTLSQMTFTILKTVARRV